MDALKKFDFKKVSIPKAIGFLLLGLVIFVVATSFIGFAFRTAFNGGNYDRGVSSLSYPESAVYYEDGFVDYARDEAYGEKLSIQNTILPPPVVGGNTTGTNAESFEVTQYSSHIETSNVDRACTAIEDLKVFDYVIFENANRYDRGCNYTFKVENEKAEEVLDSIKALNPESLNENTHTIKNIVDNYTSEVEILQKKLASIEETLLDAKRAYDQVEVLATRAQDVESLAQIIDSKIGLIERLTNERINIKERIDRINRSQADQLDRLNFTFFNVSVVENHIVDFEGLKDSWIYEIKRLVQELSQMLQALTTGLLIFLFKAIPITIYLIAALFILKYGWRGAKYMWKK